MNHNEMIERTKNDLKDFNSIVVRLRECKINLNCFQGQEELFIEDVQELNTIMRKCELKLKIIKNSLGVLCERDQQIITEHYFSKMTIKDIALKLNTSSETIFVHKRMVIEELAKIMYDHLKDFDYISFLDIPKENKKRGKSIYQYDLQENFIKKWHCANECKSNGFNADCIRDCCKGNSKQHKGYIWSYKPILIKQ